MRLVTRGGYNWTDRSWILESARKNRIRQFVIDGEASGSAGALATLAGFFVEVKQSLEEAENQRKNLNRQALIQGDPKHDS